MKWPRRNKKTQTDVIISGPLLVSDFTSAMNNLVTAETAKYVANETEQETMRTINSSAAQNAVYVTPDDLSPDAQAEIVRSSVNAHLQKAQSAQINAFTQQQLSQMESEDKQNYIGKKVRINIIDKKFQPVESCWQDSRTGEIRQGSIKAKFVNGIIDDIVFEKNVLILKPSFKDKILVPDRKFFFIYVVNPETLLPAVEISVY